MQDLWVAMSGLQKAIRRGLERDAAGWALELAKTGRAEAMWSRLFVIMSEDVGPAEPGLPAQIWALYQMWRRAGKGSDRHLFVVQAAVLLSRCKKTRVIDDLVAVAEPPSPVPDYVLDMHTAEGKRRGRGLDHFFSEAAKLENEDDREENIRYREEAREKIRNSYSQKRREHNHTLF